ncbi:hypothetical protein MAR_004531 [Mya arenaria]|uniref:Uncharacterized protein n=1 Tax=Mya arenaria TaxID=6604 RepID=A0ABY7F532_MYAAR|nr:uncharacterized protein LOC128245892 [Mya arenaria]WAR14426.1 hypothetical protein MAR_004531 [Mya arenaria]
MLLRHLALLVLMTFVGHGKTKSVSMVNKRHAMMESAGKDVIERLILRLKRGVPLMSEDGGSRATETPPTTQIVPDTPPPSPPVQAVEATTITSTTVATTKTKKTKLWHSALHRDWRYAVRLPMWPFNMKIKF